MYKAKVIVRTAI